MRLVHKACCVERECFGFRLLAWFGSKDLEWVVGSWVGSGLVGQLG